MKSHTSGYKKIVLNRAQIKRNTPDSKSALRITAGTRGFAGVFAPTWGMVKEFKAGTLSIPAYLKQYHERLRRVDRQDVVKLYEFGKQHGGELTVTCFCRPTSFCHSYYAILWLVSHPQYSAGFEIHPDLVEFVEGLDWEGKCWEYKDGVDLSERR